ncbi:hypothetical protein LZ009_15100 [Ramlibacter sp. XY19]|uniref:hypothetical protein n=1 Tax=Ramlibacter paludis TaxID=2908000 RepID=UPI0023DB4791|nr:hypothetical protein [Ramlibacter paludis]MCG2594107.1 hypothetical protein [Ramlibacter paludis]
MKLIRVWLLVLLAFALPMRGAMAAAMLCAPSGTHAHVAAAGGHHGHEHQASHDQAAAQPNAAHDHGGGHDGTDKCSSCASCCSVPATVASSITLPQGPPAAAPASEYLAPAAEFFCGGQERPPRTI